MPDAADTFRLGTDPADRPEKITIEMTTEQWGLVAMVLEDARDAADDFDSAKERDEIAAVEAIIDKAMSQT